jgi:hypothetical protein
MKTFIIGVLGATLLLSFSSSIGLKYYYTQCMPEMPVAQQDRVIPMHVFYSKTVYVTKDERNALYILYGLTGTMLLVYFIAYTRLAKKP